MSKSISTYKSSDKDRLQTERFEDRPETKDYKLKLKQFIPKNGFIGLYLIVTNSKTSSGVSRDINIS